MTQTVYQSPGDKGEATAKYLMDDPDALSFQVSREAYRSNDAFNQERNKIWNQYWLYLGHETELPKPGDFITRTLGGRPLIFVRDSNGVIRAFYNSCPHRGTILCRETGGNKKNFQCFYHAWAFKNSGELAALPSPEAYSDVEKFQAEHGLRAVPHLDIHEGFVFVNFAKEAQTLLEHLGQAAEYMSMSAKIGPKGMTTLPGMQNYSAKGNWKLMVENGLDGYHFAPTHNTFVGYLRESGYQVTDDDQYAYTLDNGHQLAVLTGHGGKIGMIWEPRFGEQERIRTDEKLQEMDERLGKELAGRIAGANRILYVFPNLLFFDLEGLNIRQIEPVAPGETEVRAWQYVEVDEPADARQLRLKIMASFVGPGGLATPDDIEAYEAVQRGIEATANASDPLIDWSDMSRGMENEVAGRKERSIDEGAMRGFWRYWAQSLDVEPKMIKTKGGAGRG